jgi:hypothetical protein
LWLGGNFFTYDGVTCRPVVKIAGGVAPYDQWLAENFSAAQVAAGDADEDADPDDDGIQNLAEMVLGTDPNLVDSGLVFGPSADGGVSVVNVGGADYLQVSIDKPSLPTGVWYVAQFGSNLTTWAPADPAPGGNAVYQVIEDSSVRFVVRDKTPVGSSPKRFARVVLKRPQ